MGRGRKSVTDLQTKSKRVVCSNCLRAQRTCICGLTVSIPHATEVLILQHPLEVHQAKGTARLLHLCLPQSRIVTGEQFDPAALHTLLYAPWPEVSGATRDNIPAQPLLLYPRTADNDLHRDDVEQAPPADQIKLRRRLVLLDGTWRKSRKMLFLNPLLATLPRLSLADLSPSRYQIRKAHRPDQLSTLEAACHAMMFLEQDTERFQPLLNSFTKFVAMQMQYAHRAGDKSEII